jgi:hypothetical protein
MVGCWQAISAGVLLRMSTDPTLHVLLPPLLLLLLLLIFVEQARVFSRRRSSPSLSTSRQQTLQVQHVCRSGAQHTGSLQQTASAQHTV